MSNCEIEIEIDRYGNKRYCLNGLLHREDGPALECVYGDKYWYKHERLHREDGPACEWGNGNKYWYLNHKCYGMDNDFTNES